ncbi:MAG: DUF3867 domain-containing protein [Clostridium sp.]|uniref:DUF3867 domain-containing protein n=1 Tax=Clostridium sp. DSM 8431 TaxID=1761781 RepID=UPI0008ECAF5A|nr:DUF3867 domain-containing protein [Clostridium sp. DSM 8431]MCR4944537.1 DUF3867 domain-containing protein [Clostridium sp.]SFU55314.1 Protein of unknown function [Clostridium sp. DSM 8431]
MDDRIIDFNQLKNKAEEKAKEKDVDKLEDYMYSLYYEMAQGKITMADFTKNMYKYMEENNISQDKFLNLQKKLMERYGFDSKFLDEQLKSLGADNINVSYDNIRKTMSFQEKYKDRLINKAISYYTIKNDKNDIEIIVEEDNVIIQSEGKIDLNDLELSDFLCSYKKVREERPLNIRLCENIKKYNY